MSIHQRLIKLGWQETGVLKTCTFYEKKRWTAVWFGLSRQLKFYRQPRVKEVNNELR